MERTSSVPLPFSTSVVVLFLLALLMRRTISVYVDRKRSLEGLPDGEAECP
jgi:hypothetical protein